MGDSQNGIPQKDYEIIVAEWAEKIKDYNLEEWIHLEVPLLKKEIMEKAKRLGVDHMDALVVVEGFRKAMKGEGIPEVFLPEGVSRRHIHDKPEETKSAVQQIARNALPKIRPKSSEGRSR